MAIEKLSSTLDAFGDRIKYETSKRGSKHITTLYGLQGYVGKIEFDASSKMATYYDERDNEINQGMFRSVNSTEIENQHIPKLLLSMKSDDLFGF